MEFHDADTPMGDGDPVVEPDAVPEYQLRMSHSWTITDRTYDPIPQDRRGIRDVPYPTYVDHSFRTRSALSSLQVARNAPIKPPALDVAFDHLWKCMPGEARRYMHIASPNGPELWGSDLHAADAMFKTMQKKVYQTTEHGSGKTIYRFYANITKRPWVILPIWVEDNWGSDWVIIVWFTLPDPEREDYYNQLLAYAIFDSRRSPEPDANGRHTPIPERMERIRWRLFQIWEEAGYDVSKAMIIEAFSSPMAFDEQSSGERSFATVKCLIKQIIDWYTGGMEFTREHTIKSMPQWVNPYQERIEMTGINAWTLMASLDYNARITVEAILPNTRTEVASDGDKKYIYNYDLAGPFEEQPIASYDYYLPSDKNYKAPSDSTRPNQFWDFARVTAPTQSGGEGKGEGEGGE
ncbi:hypothetical protein F4808DRAFT_456814 [Astrocystis sublimbata]|nr:hypothetical protein F4808DRAFT_456814 [Astrocystis sublimbata]